FGGFLAACEVGPAAAIVLDVLHPGVRSTGASVLSLFQNLFGLALGPFIGGVLSDAVGLDNALALMPLACILAAASFVMAHGGYQADKQGAAALSIVPASQGAVAWHRGLASPRNPATVGRAVRPAATLRPA